MEKKIKQKLSAGDFLVNHSVLLENDLDLTKNVEQCSLNLCDSLEYSNLSIYSLRTSKGYSITKTGKLSKQSSPRWTNWGMMQNGKCLIAKISEFHKTENECSLLDILEENVPEKYFLSKEQVEKILTNSKR